MKKSGSRILIGVLVAIVAIVIIIVAWFFSTKNSLIRLEETVSSQYSVIETNLQRRLDLIPNLVNTVKGYDIHEQEAIDSVTSARAKIGSASTETARMDAEDELTGSLSRLIAIAENYPDLKADANYQNLMDELAGTENRIMVARKDYNDSVKVYNSKIRSFPASIVANSSGMEPLPYFEASQEAQSVPTVDFTK